MCPHYCKDACISGTLLRKYPDLRMSPIRGRILYKLFIDINNQILTKCAQCEKRFYNVPFTHCPCCGSPTRERDVYQKRISLKKEKKRSKIITITVTLESGLEITKVVNQ